MKVLDIEIPLVGKNKKYTKNKYTGNLILTKEYRKFKQNIYNAAKKTSIEPPYDITLYINCYHDIDAVIQPILDSIQKKAIVNDKDVRVLTIKKNPIPKGGKSKIECYIKKFQK